jgi:hypothetical protein
MKILLAVLISYSVYVPSACAQTAAPLVLQSKIVLPGVKGKFDHLSIDEAGNRLFIAATGNKSVEVVDVATGKTTQSLTGLEKPHGLVWAANIGRLFVADGEKAELDVFEGNPLRLIKSIPLSKDADDLVYDNESKLLYVGHGGTDTSNPASVAIVDANRLTTLKQLPVAAHPEALELDSAGKRIFVNISDTGEVVVIDGKTQNIVGTWNLATAKGNTPLAYDSASDVLLVGCRTPAKLVVLSAKTGKEIDSAPISAGADDMFYEPQTHRAYVIAGSGAVDSYVWSPEGKLQVLPVTRTAAGAKTGLLVPSQRTLYVAMPGVGGAAEIVVYQTSATK